ncbi:MAG: hypothetical protein IKX96_00275, partial [Firmicutes bacterium]|nr:hypothetical protein [Bacillota bacterium]
MVTVRNEDFDIEKIADSGQCFRLNRCGNHWLNIAGDRVLRIYECGESDGVKSYKLDCSKKDFDAFWAPYFDLGCDYSTYRAAVPKKDKFLTAAASYGRGIR